MFQIVRAAAQTFAVITSITVKTFPIMPMLYLNVSISTAANSEVFWAAAAYLLAQYMSLIDSGIFGNVLTGGSFSISDSSFTALYLGFFFAPNKTLSELAGTLAPLFEHINTTWPGQFYIILNTYSYPNFYSWRSTIFPSDVGVGIDGLVVNRLLDVDALSAPRDTWIQTLKDIISPG
jgi:hypothetical protein